MKQGQNKDKEQSINYNKILMGKINQIFKTVPEIKGRSRDPSSYITVMECKVITETSLMDN